MSTVAANAELDATRLERKCDQEIAERAAARHKEGDHAEALEEMGWAFTALIWEVHGFAGPEVGELQAAIAAHRCPPSLPVAEAQRATAVRTARRRLAAVLQRGNAACVLAR